MKFSVVLSLLVVGFCLKAQSQLVNWGAEENLIENCGVIGEEKGIVYILGGKRVIIQGKTRLSYKVYAFDKEMTCIRKRKLFASTIEYLEAITIKNGVALVLVASVSFGVEKYYIDAVDVMGHTGRASQKLKSNRLGDAIKEYRLIIGPERHFFSSIRTTAVSGGLKIALPPKPTNRAEQIIDWSDPELKETRDYTYVSSSFSEIGENKILTVGTFAPEDRNVFRQTIFVSVVSDTLGNVLSKQVFRMDLEEIESDLPKKPIESFNLEKNLSLYAFTPTALVRYQSGHFIVLTRSGIHPIYLKKRRKGKYPTTLLLKVSDTGDIERGDVLPGKLDPWRWAVFAPPMLVSMYKFPRLVHEKNGKTTFAYISDDKHNKKQKNTWTEVSFDQNGEVKIRQYFDQRMLAFFVSQPLWKLDDSSWEPNNVVYGLQTGSKSWRFAKARLNIPE